MSETIAIRRAEPSDLSSIAALSDELFHEDAGQRDPFMNLEWARQEGERYFQQMLQEPSYVTYVAEDGQQAVGYLVGYVRTPNSLYPQIAAELESMFVEQPFRGQGVGRALAEAFLAWAREQGATRVTVTAYAANERAIRFYKSLGFESKQITLEVGQV